MSIDFSIYKVQETCVFDSNMTHNVSGMWREAGCYDAIYNSEGLLASECLPFLKKGYEYFKKNAKELKKLEPENGWGTYENAGKFLEELIEGCEKYPDGKISISK